MYQHLTDWETHAENMQISVCFCKTCICLKNLENIQIPVNMINRLYITDEYSVKCDFILNTVTFIDAALNISLRKLLKCNVLWFYLFGQGVPNETKGTINLKILPISKILILVYGHTHFWTDVCTYRQPKHTAPGKCGDIKNIADSEQSSHTPGHSHQNYVETIL